MTAIAPHDDDGQAQLAATRIFQSFRAAERVVPRSCSVVCAGLWWNYSISLGLLHKK